MLEQFCEPEHQSTVSSFRRTHIVLGFIFSALTTRLSFLKYLPLIGKNPQKKTYLWIEVFSLFHFKCAPLAAWCFSPNSLREAEPSRYLTFLLFPQSNQFAILRPTACQQCSESILNVLNSQHTRSPGQWGHLPT